MKHLKYLRYVLRHKYFVAKGLWYLWLRNPRYMYLLWAMVVHDFSKFLPEEWFPYVDKFYGGKTFSYKIIPKEKRTRKDINESTEMVNIRFDQAWNHHQKSNKHHWQYWLLKNDKGSSKALCMPYKFTLEMVADWYGAGMAINGCNEVVSWYDNNKDKMILHSLTRLHVERLVYRVVSNL